MLKPKPKLARTRGYQGITKLHANSVLPREKTKKNPLTKGDKAYIRAVSSRHIVNEHIIGWARHFRIISDTYHNRRNRFGLRFNLIVAVYNLNLIS
jgi:hypothetical protein